MAKRLPFRRRIVRGIASCGVVVGVLLQAFAFLVATVADRAPSGDLVYSAAATGLCRAAPDGHPPGGERHSCDLCALCESERETATSTLAPSSAETLVPRRLAAVGRLTPGVDAPPPPIGRASYWSSRAPPRA